MRSKLIALATATSLTGCSFFMTRGPHDQAAGAPVATAAPDCTTSMTWPAVDGTIGGLAAIALLSTVDNNNRDTANTNGDAVTSLIIVTGVAAAGALVGYSRVNKCRKANETFAASYNGTYGGAYPYAAQPYTAQPYPYAQQDPAQYPQQPPTYQPQPLPQPSIGATPTATPSALQTPTPAPAPKPVPVPVAQPKPTPAPTPKPAPKPTPAPTPTPSPSDAALGTEGDVCTSQSECATGFACTNNVCLKKK